MPAKEFLKANDIDYTEHNVSEDMDARKLMMKNKLMGVPSFLIDGEAVVGLNKEKLLAAKNG
ncbi:MAG: glutaredoxin family protein [Clostridiales bacterium]|nr:glutaredoxin family protein [Clostridiales bacterium]